MAFRELTQDEIYGTKPKVEEKVEVKPTTTKDFYKELLPLDKEKVLGVSRGVTQGATFGQAPQLSGITNELANLPKKLYRAKSIKDLMQLYKDTGKDYVKGREQFKTEYKDFADKNKGLAIASELAGGLLTGGGVLKGASLTAKPILNATISGAGAGALYGGSNTEGKGFDLKQAGIGGLIGGALGLGISGGGSLIKKLANNKTLKETAQAYKEGVKNTFTPYIKEKGQLSGNTVAYQVGDNDIPSELLNIMAKHGKDKKFLNEVANNSNFSKKFETYRDDLVNELKDFISSLKKKAEDMYKPYNKQQVSLTFNDGKNNVNVVDLLEKRLADYKVNAPTSSGKEKIIKQAEETIKDFKNRYMKTEVIKPQTTTTYFSEGTIPENYVPKTIVTKNEIPFKNLQDEMKKIWEIQDNIKYYDNTALKYDVEKGGEQGVRLLNDFYGILKQARDSVIPKKVSQYYANTMKLHDDLIDTFGKNYVDRDFVNKLLKENNVNRISFIDDKLKDILQKHTLGDKEIIDRVRNIIRNVDLVKASYILRNPSTKNAWNLTTNPMSTNSIFRLGNMVKQVYTNPQKKYQTLAKNILNKAYKSNILTKEFKKTGLGDTVDTLKLKNKLYTRQQPYSRKDILNSKRILTKEQ